MKRQKVKVKRQKEGEANFHRERIAVFLLPFTFLLLPFYGVP
jgi:hypothetical protein